MRKGVQTGAFRGPSIGLLSHGGGNDRFGDGIGEPVGMPW
jgi:hypothetical protein